MPTLNADKYLERSINSILSQSYPNIEIMVADGGSTDKTLAILRKFNIRPINNDRRVAEFGKYLAFKKSRGKYIVFIDSDNVLVGNDWLQKILTPFNQNGIIGVESNYLIAPDFTSINKYSNLLEIVDPLARMLASKPVIKRANGYIIREYAINSTPVSGANGFVWRKEHLNDRKYKDGLNESLILRDISRDQKIMIARVPNVGIYHYYASNVLDYVAKRKKIASKHIQRERTQTTWVSDRGTKKLILSALYLGTFIGPFTESVYNLIRTRRISWLWHPLIGAITVYVYTYYKLKEFKPKND